jgi:hypothetical protein
MTHHLEVEKGSLVWQGTLLEIGFRCDISRLGEIAIEFDAVSSIDNPSWPSQSRFLKWLSAERGQVPYFHLSGKTSDGISISTEYGYEVSSRDRVSSSGAEVLLKASASELVIDYPLGESINRENIYVAYLSRGQIGYPHDPVATPLGNLSTQAASEAAEAADNFGAVYIEKGSNIDLGEWSEACDDLVGRILNILSLAQGRWLEWTAREIRLNSQLLSLKIRPRSLREAALSQLFHHLNLGPILELAVQSYTRQLVKSTGMDVALSWMLAPASYLEGTFLNQMIALERLVSSFEIKVEGITKKEIFKSLVRPKLCQVVQDLVTNGFLSSEEASVIENRIGGINSPGLFAKLKQLISHYQVPVEDLGDLSFVIDCRNDLVHRGILEDIEDVEKISEAAALAEELVKRIVMGMLGYRGRYISSRYGLNHYSFQDGGVVPL